jgi:hypothetical protein
LTAVALVTDLAVPVLKRIKLSLAVATLNCTILLGDVPVSEQIRAPDEPENLSQQPTFMLRLVSPAGIVTSIRSELTNERAMLGGILEHG